MTILLRLVEKYIDHGIVCQSLFEVTHLTIKLYMETRILPSWIFCVLQCQLCKGHVFTTNPSSTIHKFTRCHNSLQVDSSYHIRTNVSARRGIIWGINIHLYYTCIGGAFHLQLEDSSGQGKKSTLPMHVGNEQEELTCSCQWTGWIWEITFWSSRLSRKSPTLSKDSMEYTSN